MNKRILGVVVMAVAGLTVGSIANAASCRNVGIKVDNQSDKYLKVKSVLYKCEGENERREQFNNVEVQPRQLKTVAANQDLAGCKDKRMQYIEVEFEPKCDSRWASERTVRDSSFANAWCTSDAGKDYTVQIASVTCN